MSNHDIDEEAVRLTAYFLWEQDGHPEGRAQEYWYRAWAQHRRARASEAELARPVALSDIAKVPNEKLTLREIIGAIDSEMLDDTARSDAMPEATRRGGQI